MTPIDEMIDGYGPDNRLAFDRLIGAIDSGCSAALIGAGLSMRLGYPSWGALLKLLKERACEFQPADRQRLEALSLGDDMLVLASSLKDSLGTDRYCKVMRDVFSPRMPPFDSTHSAVVALPFRHILTTNYDESLQAAYSHHFDSPPTSLVLASQQQVQPFIEGMLALPLHIVHLHGSVTEPSGIVLTLDDYDRVYHTDPFSGLALQILFALHTIVFIGFSMSDEDVMLRFGNLARILGRGGVRHFALLPAPDAAKLEARRSELRERFRLEPVFYDSKSNHELLPSLLAQLVSRTTSKREDAVARVSVQALDAAISEVLPTSPDIAARLRERLIVPAVVTRPHPDWPNTEGTEGTRSSLDLEIDSIFRFIKQGLPLAAVSEYEALLARHASTLTPRLRYRLHANIGNALARNNDPKGAAHSYLLAVSFYKVTKEARALECLAYVLLGEMSEANALGVALCIDEPGFGRAHALRIRSLPPEVPLEAAEASIPKSVESDPEVCAALGDLAGRRGNLSSQETYLRRAIEAAPDWVELIIALASTILNIERQRAVPDIDRGLVPTSSNRLEEAGRLASNALSLIPRTVPPSNLAQAYLTRAAIRRLLGPSTEGRADIAMAYTLAPELADAGVAEALARADEGNLPGAVRCLESLAPDGRLFQRDGLLALFLEQKGTTESKARALQVLSPWLSRLLELEDVEHRANACLHAVRLFVQCGRLPEARQFVEALPGDVLPVSSLAVVKARLAMGDSRMEEATKSLAEAADGLNESSTWLQKREVADLAQDLLEWPTVFRVLRSLVPTSRFNSDSKRLLKAAYLAREESFLLQYCHSLREANIHAWECYEVEADILVRHREPERALALLGEWIAMNPAHDEARVGRAFLARQLGNSAIADEDMERLPGAAVVGSPNRGAQVVYVLRYSKKPVAGLEYAYELWRRFPDDIIARRALVSALYDPMAPSLGELASAEATSGAAVQIQQGEEQPRWIVLETGPQPSLTRGEYPPDHPLARAVVGCIAGAEFSYNRMKYRVLRVESRFVLRAQETLSSFQDLFPESQFIQRFKVNLDQSGSTTPQVALGEMWKELEQQEATRKRLETLQQDKGAPLAMIAQRLGRSVHETVGHFASRPDLRIRCADGRSEEWPCAVKDLQGRSELVLDPTAVATISIAGLVPLLQSLPHRLLVPRSVIDELRGLIPQNDGKLSPRGVIGSNEGQLFFHEYTQEELSGQATRIKALVAALSERCTLLGATALLDLEPTVRDRLVQSLGEGTADAIAIARERKALLWTDDLSIGQLAVSLGVEGRVWSHAVLKFARDQGSVKPEAVLDMTGVLLTCGYTFIGISTRDAIELLRRGGWNTDSGTGAVVCKHLEVVPLDARNNVRILMLVIASIWSECPSERIAKTIIRKLLSGIGRKVSGPLIARPLYRAPHPVLGMSESKMKRLRSFLRKWRSDWARVG